MKLTINRDFKVNDRVKFVFPFGRTYVSGKVTATDNNPVKGPKVRVQTDGENLPSTGWYAARFWRIEETME